MNKLTTTNDNTQSITLSASCTKVLVKLVESDGVLVSRESFFVASDECDFEISSNSNLNHCISILRKCFRTMGIENDIIKTIPKEGFIFDAGIAIPHLQADDNVTSKIPFGSINEKTTPKLSMTLASLGIAFALILSIGMTYLWYESKSNVTQENNFMFIAEKEGCSIYTTDNIPPYQRDALADNAFLQIKKLALACGPENIFIYYNQNISFGCPDTSGREFLVQCIRQSNGSLGNCASYNSIAITG